MNDQNIVEQPSQTSWESFLESVHSPLPRLREMAIFELPAWAESGYEVGDILNLALKDSDSVVVRAAAIITGRLKKNSEDILRALETKLSIDDDLLRRTIVTTLVRLGIPAIPILMKLLGDRDAFIRRFVALAFEQLGEPAVDPLVEALRDKLLRRAAASILVQIGKPAVSKLIPKLECDDFEVRFSVIDILEQIGPIVVPTLIEQIKSGKTPQEQGGDALTRFGPDAVPELIITMRDKEIGNRCWAAAILVKIGQPAAPGLLSILMEGNAGTAYLASKALVQIGVSAIPTLFQALGTTTKSVRWIVSNILVQMGEEAIESLENGLLEIDPLVREASAHALGEMGGSAWAALPNLESALQDEVNSDVKIVLRQAIEKLRIFD